MTAVIQIVSSARVVADGTESGDISRGLYILLGVTEGDNEEDCRLLADKISRLRIFADENGKMNLSVNDICGEVMIVSNFTLNANYSHGNRPDYLRAMKPDAAEKLYEHFKVLMSQRVRRVASGVFGAHMTTEMITEGPVTIVMDSSVLRGGKV